MIDATARAHHANWLAQVVERNDDFRPIAGFGDATWTGRQLLDCAAGYGDWLDTLGIDPNSAVPALISTSAASLALLIGGAGSRHPVAPLGTRMTAHEIAVVLNGLHSPVVVVQPEFVGLAEQAAARVGVRVVAVPEPAASDRALSAGPDDIAMVLHTSGTTGTPKPVPYPQSRLAARAAIVSSACGLDPDSRYGATAPFHHVAGVGNIAIALWAGSALTGVGSFSVDAWRILTDRGITHTTLVPAMLEILLRAGRPGYPGLRNLQYGGAPIRPETAQRTYQAMPGVRMVNMFGQTEGSPITILTAQDHRDAIAARPDLLRSVGRPAQGTEVRIGAPDTHGVGEVQARGDHLFVVDDDGWLHSGDFGSIDAQGYLYLSGRAGDRIVRGGENVYPLEVEHVLAEHPGVDEAAVVGIPDERLGQTVVAFVVPAPAGAPDPRELHRFARERMSGFKVPVQWHFVGELPRNPSGKLLRRRLVEGLRTR